MHFVRLNHEVIERTRNVHLHYSRLHNVCVCSVWLFFAKYSMSNRTSLKQQLWYYHRRYIFHTPSWDFVLHQKKPALSCLLAHCQSQNMCSARAARLVGYSKSNKGGRIFVKSQLHFCFPKKNYDSLTELESLRGIRIRTRIIQFLTEDDCLWRCWKTMCEDKKQDTVSHFHHFHWLQVHVPRQTRSLNAKILALLAPSTRPDADRSAVLRVPPPALSASWAGFSPFSVVNKLKFVRCSSLSPGLAHTNPFFDDTLNHWGGGEREVF